MIRRADKILVFDLELTCWEPLPPPDMSPEIIQIGYCFLNLQTGERSGMDSLYVRPIKSTISEFCTELTGITPKLIKRGQCLPTVSQRLLKLGTKQYASACYGDDWACVNTECQKANCNTFLSDEWINVSTLTKLAFNNYKCIGLRNACEQIDLAWEGEAHRAEWDAWNTAGLLYALLTRHWRNVL